MLHSAFQLRWDKNKLQKLVETNQIGLYQSERLTN